QHYRQNRRDWRRPAAAGRSSARRGGAQGPGARGSRSRRAQRPRRVPRAPRRRERERSSYRSRCPAGVIAAGARGASVRRATHEYRLDNDEEERNEEDAEEGAEDHPAEHPGSDRVLRSRARPVREREREDTEAEGE